MKKVVYLLGAGATQSEILANGWVGKSVLMKDIGTKVQAEALKKNEYKRIEDDLAIDLQQVDVEQAISLLDDLGQLNSRKYGPIATHLRKLFFKQIIENLSFHGKHAAPKNLLRLLLLHKKYPQNMGDGEELSGVLTLNFDDLIDSAFLKAYGGKINYGVATIEHIDITNIPPLLKLHGSFNWASAEEYRLRISAKLGMKNLDPLLCLPPSVYKRTFLQQFPFDQVWTKAYQLLHDCDVLRVIGSALRKEDWPLISLIFSTQLTSVSKYKLEIMLPQPSLTDLRSQLPFLGNLAPSQRFYSKDYLKQWLDKRYTNATGRNRDIRHDRDINATLGGR